MTLHSKGETYLICPTKFLRCQVAQNHENDNFRVSIATENVLRNTCLHNRNTPSCFPYRMYSSFIRKVTKEGERKRKTADFLLPGESEKTLINCQEDAVLIRKYSANFNAVIYLLSLVFIDTFLQYLISACFPFLLVCIIMRFAPISALAINLFFSICYRLKFRFYMYLYLPVCSLSLLFSDLD